MERALVQRNAPDRRNPLRRRLSEWQTRATPFVFRFSTFLPLVDVLRASVSLSDRFTNVTSIRLVPRLILTLLPFGVLELTRRVSSFTSPLASRALVRVVTS